MKLLNYTSGILTAFFFGASSFLFIFLAILSLIKNISWLFIVPFMGNFPNSFAFTIFFDWLSLLFLRTVSLIAGSVFLFSHFYIDTEKFKLRFNTILTFFVLRIFLLILRGDIIFIIMGWDGLGITSYILVIYFNRIKSNNARLLTALSNRVGDVAIIIFIALSLSEGTLKFSISEFSPSWGFILILARFTKRAQVPFSAWLPAAIAAPTPVSALVHSSTLVTAGVYLLLRLRWLLNSFYSSLVLIIFGRITLFMARISALAEIDFKKIVALSTLRQLGLIVCIVGLNQPLVAFFHLNTHAFFKSLLFIVVGDIIHNSGGWQDLRKIDLFSTHQKVLVSLTLLANLRLSGMPFLAGFYSKDLFLEINFFFSQSFLFITFIFITLFLTVLYSIRAIFLRALNSSKILNLSSLIGPLPPQWYYSSLLFLTSLTAGRAIRWLILPYSNFVFLPAFLKSITFFIFIARLTAFISKFPLKNFYPRPLTAPFYKILFLDSTVGQLSSSSISFLTHPLIRSPEFLFLPIERFINIIFFIPTPTINWNFSKSFLSSLIVTISFLILLWS